MGFVREERDRKMVVTHSSAAQVLPPSQPPNHQTRPPYLVHGPGARPHVSCLTSVGWAGEPADCMLLLHIPRARRRGPYRVWICCGCRQRRSGSALRAASRWRGRTATEVQRGKNIGCTADLRMRCCRFRQRCAASALGASPACQPAAFTCRHHAVSGGAECVSHPPPCHHACAMPLLPFVLQQR